jgi:hypothetical protein
MADCGIGQTDCKDGELDQRGTTRASCVYVSLIAAEDFQQRNPLDRVSCDGGGRH